MTGSREVSASAAGSREAEAVAGPGTGDPEPAGKDKPLTVGGPGILLDLAGPGSARFEAAAGQRLSVLARRKTLTATDNTDLVIRRDGAAVAEGTLITTWSDVTVDFTAPAAGTYTVEVTPRAADRGTVLVSLAGATTGTLAPGGASKRVTIGKPGERAFLTFEAAAGRELTLVARRGSLPRDEYTHLEVRDAAGRVETAGAVGYEAGYRTLDFVTTAAGRHTVEINPDTAHTGTLTVQLVGTVTAELTPAEPVRLTLTRPGERAHVTFPAVEGEQFQLTARRDTLTSGEQTHLRLRTPAGLEVADGALTSAKPSVTLPFSSSAGTYTLEVDPEGLDTGSVELTLTRLR
ncbi:PPC domain-containing protein [Actinoplanes sp. G11-F43]|uniref:PPC domain-containing protein n=1 Tax=Actinoplanes sp. G11-F43 TaxID=3424130 RepID=UPI003D356AF8